MKRNARYAYDALKKIGAPLLDSDLGWGGHFALSAECYGRDDGFYPGHKDSAPNGLPWADYYNEYNIGDFGVNPAITEVLSKYDLYAEWVNPAVLAVYDA